MCFVCTYIVCVNVANICSVHDQPTNEKFRIGFKKEFKGFEVMYHGGLRYGDPTNLSSAVERLTVDQLVRGSTPRGWNNRTEGTLLKLGFPSGQRGRSQVPLR